MFARSLVLGLSLLALGAPCASAAVSDPVVPFYDAADGVQAGQGKRNVYLRVGPKAAKLYRTFAGHTVRVGCARQAVDDDGALSGGSIRSDGRLESFGPGYTWTELRLPRKRGRVNLPFTGKPYDVCFIATNERRSDDACMPAGVLPANPQPCVRIIVALTDTGRAMVEERARTIELSYVSILAGGSPSRPATTLARLQREFGPDVVALEGPDAAPPIGKVGFWHDGQTTVVAVLLSDGRRWFVRHDGEVYSTNVSELTGGSLDAIRLP